jgi:hypothetical protein
MHIFKKESLKILNFLIFRYFLFNSYQHIYNDSSLLE